MFCQLRQQHCDIYKRKYKTFFRLVQELFSFF